MLRSHGILFSYVAPSTAGFVGISPRQNRGAQEAAAIEPPFLWILSGGIPTQSITAIKLSENLKAWSAIASAIAF
jgi:hypothetical protein